MVWRSLLRLSFLLPPSLIVGAEDAGRIASIIASLMDAAADLFTRPVSTGRKAKSKSTTPMSMIDHRWTALVSYLFVLHKRRPTPICFCRTRSRRRSLPLTWYSAPWVSSRMPW